MKLEKKAGATSEIWQIWIADTSSTTGAGLTGLVFNSASLTAYFHRDTDTTATAISLQTMTVGTFTSSGFKEIDSTNMPGWYQFCPPNAAIAAGAKSCAFYLKGAANMAPLAIEVQLTATDVDSATAFMTSVGSVVGAVGSVTGAVGSVTGAVGSVTGNVGGNVVGSVASVTAGVTVTTNNDKTGYGLSAAAVQAIWDALTSALTTVGSIGKLIVTNLDALISSRMATYTQPTGFLAATFPTTVASPTNITGGVITTVTTLTNLPSIPANWITAAGINAAALNGKGDWNIGKTGYALSAAGVQAIWDALTSALTTVGSVGKLIVDNLNATISSVKALLPAALVGGRIDASVGAMAAGVQTSASYATSSVDANALATDAVTEIVNGVLAGVVEGTTTVQQSLRLANSALGGKSSGHAAGSPVYRDLADATDRITATTDVDGNRTAVTRSL